MSDVVAAIEPKIREAHARADLPRATRLILEHYGPEILGFLVARLRNQDDGDEAYSLFSEDVWRGIGGFQFRCSARCWAYTIARNAGNRLAAVKARRAECRFPTQNSLHEFPAPGRQSTVTLHRIETTQRLRVLRDRLPADDRTLLILRIDRGLSWRELARVMSGEVDDDALIERETVRVRKRFERVKGELRRLAVDAGLVT